MILQLHRSRRERAATPSSSVCRRAEQMRIETVLRILRRALRITTVTVGLALGFCCAAWTGFAAYGMDVISVSEGATVSSFVWEGWSLTPRWTALLALYSLAFPLTSSVTPRSRSDMLPIAVAVWTALVTFGFGRLAADAQFMLRDRRDCTYDGCWPAGWQELMASAPLFITLITWVVLSLLADRIPPVVRLAVPPLLFLILSIALAAVWRPYIVPILLGPPPF